MKQNNLLLRSLSLALLATTGFALDATVLESRIDAVTVYADSARVTRVAPPLSASGRYVFEGLTSELDPQNVRVRLSNGHVLGVEVEQRWVQHNPEERLQQLRSELQQLEREQQARRDEFDLLEELRVHTEGQLKLVPEAGKDTLMPSLEAWQAGHEYYSVVLRDLLRSRRELRWEGEAADVQMQSLREQMGALDSGGSLLLNDVFVDVEFAGNATGDLALEYFVSGCGWTPSYDLRTAGDARKVELTYRAAVQQQSGEDWNAVELALSTARPRRGAVGPEPVARWVDFGSHPERSRYDKDASNEAKRESVRFAAGFAAGRPALAAPFAVAQSSGLSVRFVLPARESLASRPAATTVLVGEASLKVEPELYCAPALEETVWLRGIAKNTSPYVLLPGRAAIFFGDDFIGNAELDQVQTGQKLELALGAVPGITAQHDLIAEEHDPPGFLSSTAEEISRWRVRLSNNGSPVSEADGSVRVIVREAIPRSRDERLEVEVSESSLAVSKLPRWSKDLDDKSILTWIVQVPARGETDLTWEITISHPNSKRVVQD